MKGLAPSTTRRPRRSTSTPASGYYKCFGCGEGGDVDQLPAEDPSTSASPTRSSCWPARPASPLTYEEGGSRSAATERNQRQRLLEAHAAARRTSPEQLRTNPEAETRSGVPQGARLRRVDAGTSSASATRPTRWDALTGHLKGKGFSDEELLAGGLLSQGRARPYDRFRGRLVWPIRDVKRRHHRLRRAQAASRTTTGPKYLNTPETPIYKKSQVLYGVDLARRDIATRRRAVSSRATPTSWPATWRARRRRWRPAVRRSAASTSRSCGAC